MYLQNLKSAASSPKRSRDADHTPFWGKFFTLGVRLAVVDPPAKFEQRSLIHSRNIEGGLKFQKRSRDPDDVSFGNIFLPLGWDLP